jgi:hypothetical protein
MNVLKIETIFDAQKEKIKIKPKVATKQLKLQNCNAGKKLVVSTNWLPLFGFESNSIV